MMTDDDMTLVREFATRQSEPAFAALVDRHLGLVHSAALRQAGDQHLAAEIAQAVFILLARKAATLGPKTILAAWLYRTTRYAAADALKARRRRQSREQEAFMQSTLNESTNDAWRQLAPLLDDALAQLGETDRTALILRYFENKSTRDIAAALRMEEAAAQKRVVRALDKLRAIFGKQGVILTTTAIAGAVAANAVHAVPAGLTMTVNAASLAAAGTGTLGFLQFMNLLKLKLGIGALVVAGTTTAFVLQHQGQIKLRAENDSLQQQMAQLQTNNESLSNRLAATASSPQLSAGQFAELLKLRGEVSLLQGQAGELAKLREENQRLQVSLRSEPTLPAAAETPEQQQRAVIRAKLNDSQQGVLALLMFASDNQQQFPTNFSQVAPYMKDSMAQIETNFSLVYQGETTRITNPSQTIVLMENQPWQAVDGNWLKIYGFADGHSEVHVEPGGNFTNWENQHLILPPSNQ